MHNTIVVDHPVGKKALEQLRQRDLPYNLFRLHSETICKSVITEAAKDLGMQNEVVVISILRAGIAMLGPVLGAIPYAKVGFVGLERDEQTAVANEYYLKLPVITENSLILILDPMLATGGSIHHVLKKLDSKNPKEIRVISVISAPEGIKKIHADFPNVRIFSAAVDRGLDSKKYIVPGLGDYGDRYFGTG